MTTNTAAPTWPNVNTPPSSNFPGRTAAAYRGYANKDGAIDRKPAPMLSDGLGERRDYMADALSLEEHEAAVAAMAKADQTAMNKASRHGGQDFGLRRLGSIK